MRVTLVLRSPQYSHEHFQPGTTAMKHEHNGKKTHMLTTAEPKPDREDKIRRRAYEIYEVRGCESGHDVDDWLLARS